MWKRLWGVTLLLVLASNLCWAQYRFNGTFYQLRWGQTEGSEDLITPVNALGNPLCVKMGTSWSAYLDGVGNLLGWKVSYARLRSLVDGTVFRLKVLLDAWNTGRWTSRCVDCSCLTMLAICSVGIDFSTRMLTQTASGNFTTNPLCAIGSDPTRDDTYSPWFWAWHQICIPTGDMDPPSNQARVWDPTGAHKEDMSGNGYRNPPAHHPTHFWHQKDYWQKPHTQLPNAWLGLVGAPAQTSNDPQLYGCGTWKCSVTTL